MSSTTAAMPEPAQNVSGNTSTAPKTQDDHAKDFHETATEVAHKLEDDPASLTAEEANHLKSTEAKHTGIQQPPKDSISAAAARVVAAHERVQHVHEDAAVAAHKVLEGEKDK